MEFSVVDSFFKEIYETSNVDEIDSEIEKVKKMGFETHEYTIDVAKTKDKPLHYICKVIYKRVEY